MKIQPKNHEDAVRLIIAQKMYVKTRRAVKKLTEGYPEIENQILQTMEATCKLYNEVFNFHPSCHAAVLIIAQATKEMIEEREKLLTGKVILL